jgi:hypothetical protein
MPKPNLLLTYYQVPRTTYLLLTTSHFSLLTTYDVRRTTYHSLPTTHYYYCKAAVPGDLNEWDDELDDFTSEVRQYFLTTSWESVIYLLTSGTMIGR